MTAGKHQLGSLLGLSAALATILALELIAGPLFVPDAPASSQGVNTAILTDSGSPPERPDISAFAEILQRPLFAETRRPPSPKAMALAAVEEKVETFDLVGVIISPGGRMALLRAIATSEVTRAVEGQNVGGWEVANIKPTEVLLKRGDESQVIRLIDAGTESGNTDPPNADQSYPAEQTDQPSLHAEAPRSSGEPPPGNQTPVTGQVSLPTASGPQPEETDEVTTE